MKKLVVLVLLLGLFGCGESEYKTKPDELESMRRLTPQELEKSNPLDYCEIEKTEHSNNFWGTESTVHVYVKITSKYTEYKDMEFNVQYLSKTGSVIQEKKYTRYDYFQPNHSYKIGIDLPPAPKEANNYQVQIISMKYSKEI